MNTLNGKTNESNKFIYQFTEKLNLKNPSKNIALANLSIYYTWKNIKSEYNNNKFKISAPTWNDEFNLPDGSYSVYDIQDYFEYIIKKHEYIIKKHETINRRNNVIIRKLKIYYFINKNKDSEIVPRLETVEVALVHYNLVNNNYQQASKVLFTFVPNKQFAQLITITPLSLTMLKTTKAEVSSIEIWFTDQNNRPPEIEDNVNITLIIGIS